VSCEACQLSKHHCVPFPSRVVSRVSRPFELVHSNIWGLGLGIGHIGPVNRVIGY
jgi:hypothetical protein